MVDFGELSNSMDCAVPIPVNNIHPSPVLQELVKDGVEQTQTCSQSPESGTVDMNSPNAVPLSKVRGKKNKKYLLFKKPQKHTAEAAGLEPPLKTDNKMTDCEPSAIKLFKYWKSVKSPPIKKTKSAIPQPKNPISTLNELYPGLEYRVVSQEGPSHAPVFTLSVTVNGEVFMGFGKSKKLAKYAVAENILKSSAEDIDSTSQVKSECDFSSDEVIGNFTNGGINEAKPNVANEEKTPKEISMQKNKNPVMLLNEIRQGVEYELVKESGEPHARLFMFTVKVDGQTFDGTGNSKKAAKAAAARQALSNLFCVVSASSLIHCVPYSSVSNNSLPQAAADSIAKLVCEKFMDLVADNVAASKRKVLAGIVMSNEDYSEFKIIGISTGTKCVNGEKMSLKGLCVNDCHAEILSRRCLINFLYSELTVLKNNLEDPSSNKECVFEIVEEENTVQLKPCYKFHLYINTAPCGDSRIFSPHEEEALQADRHPNRQSRGLLRTKIESGEGTIPIKAEMEIIQTWDGILQGERLRTMSCSDKLALWNVVGLQGSLLSHFIKPIYLESIVLGSLFHSSHLYRALCGRYEHNLRNVIPPYHIHKPMMNQGSSIESRQPQKAPTIAVNWDCVSDKLEILNAITGRQDNGMPSRLSKRTFFDFFTILLHSDLIKYSSLSISDFNEISYGEVKSLNKDYHANKEALIMAFKTSGLGHWIEKPVELDAFYI